MARIRTGKQHGHSKSEIDLALRPQSTLEFESGDLHDNSKQSLKVQETPGEEAMAAQGPASGGTSTEFWAKGTFLVVAFAAIGAVIGAIAQRQKWYAVPVVVVGAIIVLYLIGLILLPHGPLTEKGLLSVIQPYLRQVFAIRATPTEGRQPRATRNRS